MNKREWLISRGLAKPGRGRLSKEAHDALAEAERNGVEFDEGQAVEEWKPAPTVPYTKTRLIRRHLIGYTEEGWEVGFDTCRRCALYVNYCNCKEGILTPSIVVTLDEYTQQLIRRPGGKPN